MGIQSIVYFSLVLLSTSFRLGSGECDGESVAYLAASLDITYEVVQNYPGQYPQMRMNWTNAGPSVISTRPWAVFLTHPADMEPASLRPDGALLGSTGLKVFHVNGALLRIEPTNAFQPLGPGQTLPIPFTVAYGQAARMYIYPNWYAASQDSTCDDAAVIVSTTSEDLSFVTPFTRPQQWKRSSSDLYNPYTPLERYNLDYVNDFGEAPYRLIPTPAEQLWDPERTINLKDPNWVIMEPLPQLASEAQYLSGALQLPIVSVSEAPARRRIVLNIGSTGVDPPEINSPESYLLIVDADFEVVNITGNSRSGVFYGIQSLIGLSDSPVDSGEVPHGVVRDGPRFEYRGMHIDVSRNFHSMADLERLMDVMAQYKLSKLHLHLADDEGWRLEIPEIPELTEVGSKRCHDLIGDRCIIPQFGSAPTLPNAGSGYYTVEQYKSLLRYASTRHIEVIPEVDMPGHAHAAINAMLARYRKYNATDVARATEFLLSDLQDTSLYLSIQGFTDNAINPCIESTYSFIKTVVASVIDMHRDIQPLKVFHMGGDEVPRNAWSQSPICAALGIPVGDLKKHFITRMAQIAADAQVGMSLWEDGLYSGGVPIDKGTLPGEDISATVWDNIWEWGSGDHAYVLANNDYKVILSHATHLYFDMPQEPDPEERGQYWATRLTPTKKVFGFIPDNIYENIGVDVNGYPLDKNQICQRFGCPPLLPGKDGNVIGMQGQLWSEQVRTSSELDSMIYPRLLALAERSWHKASWEDLQNEAERDAERDQDWARFASTLGYKELRRLDARGVAYRLPVPGVRVSASNVMEVSSAFPGLPRYYSLNGSTWVLVEGDVQLTSGAHVQVAIRSTDGLRSSRVVSVTAN